MANDNLQRKTSVSGGDRRELSVCSIHPQSDAHWNNLQVYEHNSFQPYMHDVYAIMIKGEASLISH